ncbi:unnamed protein product [Amoebophrya sp. A120]|nr:unnamed protein product [Amoebophrya sp. A120]|eukprot:GSA120T00023435001.1
MSKKTARRVTSTSAMLQFGSVFFTVTYVVLRRTCPYTLFHLPTPSGSRTVGLEDQLMVMLRGCRSVRVKSECFGAFRACDRYRIAKSALRVYWNSYQRNSIFRFPNPKTSTIDHEWPLNGFLAAARR